MSAVERLDLRAGHGLRGLARGDRGRSCGPDGDATHAERRTGDELSSRDGHRQPIDGDIDGVGS